MKFNIDKGSFIFLKCTFDSSKNLKIGKDSVINSNCRIDTRGGVEIGENVSISSDVTILTADHDMNCPHMTGRQKKVVIEDYVWIGTKAIIMPGITIKKGAVIGVGAVVTKNVNSFDVVAGVPAKVIKKRPEFPKFKYSASYKRLFQ